MRIAIAGSLEGEGAAAALEPSNERMIPDNSDELTFWEHVYRYAFASAFVEGKRVLDIACGEGYGAAALRGAGAVQVIGVDISDAVCRHVRTKYGIETTAGNAESIPLADRSVDVIVSFETIEHVSAPDRFLSECVRVLTPGGTLIVSTPNRGFYEYQGDTPNPYHLSEMTEQEFISGLRSRFYDLSFYTQRPYSAAWWSPRTLVSKYGLWRHIPGFSRLPGLAQFLVTPEVSAGLTKEVRSSASDMILKIERRRRRLFNPFAVRRRRAWTGEKPTYVIGVGKC